MDLSNLLKLSTAIYYFCNQKASIPSPECRRTFQAGWNQTIRLAAGVPRSNNQRTCPRRR